MGSIEEVICVECRSLLIGKLNVNLEPSYLNCISNCSQFHASLTKRKEEDMKQFTRLFRKFFENSNNSTNEKWTRLKRNAFGKYLLVTNTFSSGLLMVAGGI